MKHCRGQEWRQLFTLEFSRRGSAAECVRCCACAARLGGPVSAGLAAAHTHASPHCLLDTFRDRATDVCVMRRCTHPPARCPELNSLPQCWPVLACAGTAR